MTYRLPVNGYTKGAPSGYCAGPGGMSRYVRNLLSQSRRHLGAHDEKPGQIYAACLSSVISDGIPHFERQLSESRRPKPDAGEEQRRLRLCLLENEILLLHD